MYNVKQMGIYEESADVQGETVDSWKECLPEIVEGYGKDDIWSVDEMGLFGHALPERGFV